MAKKPTIRVHQVAKKLGVSSKDIVAKCKQEGLEDITTHMSVLSVGLSATITEWFSDGSAKNTVQVAAPVDLDKVRVKRKKKVVKKSVAQKEKIDSQVNEEKTEKSKTKHLNADTKSIESQDKNLLHEKNDQSQIASSLKPRKVAVARPNIPRRPTEVAQVGKTLAQPSKVKLSGPKVVRVENPEPEEKPRPRQPKRSVNNKSIQSRDGGIRNRSDSSGGGAGVAPGIGAEQFPPQQGRSDGRGGRRQNQNKRRTAERTPARNRSAIGNQDRSEQVNWRYQDLVEREQRLQTGGVFERLRRDRGKKPSGGGERVKTAAETGGTVEIQAPITVKSLSAVTGIKSSQILKKLIMDGEVVTINSEIEIAKAESLMLEWDITLEVKVEQTREEKIAQKFKERKIINECPRSPVVTILGHVDHGKTSLLDSIRKSKVAEGEAGGITQATSAFRVTIEVNKEEREITFIDTPGHEAFTEMRSRGAKVTDVVVLVVAADDGVMPQTIESINHALAAEVPIIVALNKIDKPEATEQNIQRILGQLAEHGLNPTEWGGTTEIVKTNAVAGEGISDLLEIIDLQAQILELKADFAGSGEGTVLEACLEEGRGAVANCLVQQGEFNKGDYVVVGRAYGRIRAMIDDQGNAVKKGGPSTPVAITGINGVPDAGDHIFAVKNQREAEAAANERIEQERKKSLAREQVTLDNIFDQMATSAKKQLPLIIKADVQGSVETLQASISKIDHEEISVILKHSAVGGINDSDISLAEATGAIIFGFNVTSSSAARRSAEEKKVDIRYYDVIYDILDDLKKAMGGLLDPEVKLEILGHAQVKEVFKISKVGTIAGCYVTDGEVRRNAKIRVTRGDIVIEKDRRLEQLKRFKEDVKDVPSGQECGMRVDGYDDIQPDDIIECYLSREVVRTVE